MFGWSQLNFVVKNDILLFLLIIIHSDNDVSIFTNVLSFHMPATLYLATVSDIHLLFPLRILTTMVIHSAYM